MSEAIPKINFTEIAFPSDRLTVKALRAAFPHSFDLPAHLWQQSKSRGYGRASTGNAIDGIIDAERLVAAIAFKTALGEPLSKYETALNRLEIIAAMTTDYGRVGLAGGEYEVKELIQSIEAQAIAQAHRLRGRPR